jgi:DNA/RNA-binding domain of Phe-tRNA-synthetase-like protein
LFQITDGWKNQYPDAFIGVLAMDGVINPSEHRELEGRKAALESELRARFSKLDRTALRGQPVLQAYHDFYKRFKKSYHVQLQLESIVFKGKSIPRVAALVEAMFMSELQSQLLTAGHDLDLLKRPVAVHVADGTEQFERMNGQRQTLKAGDMYIADTEGILSSVIYGPDRRTQIRSETRRVFFTTYAPPGITREAVQDHLSAMRDNILLVSPTAQVELLSVYGAS